MSILHQLKKYQPETKDTPEIIVHEKNRLPSEYELIIRNLSTFPRTPVEAYEKHISEMLSYLSTFHKPPLTNIIYPLELAIAYHIFYNYSITLTHESIIDIIMFGFIESQNQKEYIAELKKSMDETVSKIFLSRVLLATFCGTEKYLDKLSIMPLKFRAIAAKLLRCNATAKNAADIMDSCHKNASIEQIIIGRILYVAAWYWKDNETDGKDILLQLT